MRVIDADPSVGRPPAKVPTAATRVRAAVDGRLTAECRPCRVHLEQLSGADVERALAAFDQAHPPTAAVHRHTLPWGWRVAPAPAAC